MLLSLFHLIQGKYLKPLRQMSQLKLSGIQFLALTVLYKQGTTPIKELTGDVEYSKQQMTPILNRLIALEYVSRHNPEDRRAVRVGITAVGRKAMETINPRNHGGFSRKAEPIARGRAGGTSGRTGTAD